MEIVYKANEGVAAKQIADLRQAVGWNRMESAYMDERMVSYCHIACYADNQLIGYVDSVSNTVTDAYIQDVMVHPVWQGKGIGTELMNRMIARLKENKIYMISIIYGETKLAAFYKRFGFHELLCGQMQTFQMD